MRTIQKYLLIAFALVVVTAFQCEKCFEGTNLLKGTRPWLPLKGRTQLNFIDRNGTETNFKVRVIDTIQTYDNMECSSKYRVERIELSIYLNTAQTDSIWAQLGAPRDVCLHANSGDTLYMSTCRFINAPAIDVVKPFTNYQVGGRVYADVRLFLANEGNNKSTDSIVLARDFGVVAFKYKGNNYLLK
jgi:hypothetical protein